MQKIIILSLLFILSGCSIDWNWEKDKKIAELEKEISELNKEKENDLFTKRQECGSKFTEINSNMTNFKSSIWLQFELDNIFYSPILNDCLYVDYMIDNNIQTTKRLMRYGSNISWNPIESCIYNSTLEIPEYNNCGRFDRKLQEIKWE